MPSDFNIRMATANGMASAAEVRLREVRLDTIDVADVPAIVMPQGAMATSLLGMSFLEEARQFRDHRRQSGAEAVIGSVATANPVLRRLRL